MRFSNPFLCILGSACALASMVRNDWFWSFMFGLCFGQIYLNYRADRKKWEEENKNNKSE